MKKMMRRIAVYNHKGGIGKTTIAVHLAYYAEELKIRTFATCIDPQGDLWRWLSGGDAIQTDEAIFERGSLTAVYARGVVPDFRDDVAELMIVDCSPDIELSLTLKPHLWVVPVHGRMGFENMTSVIEDLRSVGDVLVVCNSVGRGGRRAMKDLRHALSCIKGLKVAETELIESDTITRSGELYRPVWDIPYANRSRAPGIMKKLCREVFKTAKVPLSPRGPQLVVED